MSHVGHHRAKYARWISDNENPDFARALADCGFWLEDGRRSLEKMQPDTDAYENLLEHLADLEDAHLFLTTSWQERQRGMTEDNIVDFATLNIPPLGELVHIETGDRFYATSCWGGCLVKADPYGKGTNMSLRGLTRRIDGPHREMDMTDEWVCSRWLYKGATLIDRYFSIRQGLIPSIDDPGHPKRLLPLFKDDPHGCCLAALGIIERLGRPTGGRIGRTRAKHEAAIAKNSRFNGQRTARVLLDDLCRSMADLVAADRDKTVEASLEPMVDAVVDQLDALMWLETRYKMIDTLPDK